MIDAQQIKCPSCNGGLKLTQNKSKIISCHYCGSVLDLKQSSPIILEKLRAKNYPRRSFLNLGMIGRIDGKMYQIIARTCLKSSIKEWDFKDRRYYTEPWKYDDWLLVDENRSFIHISEDQEGYSVAKPFVPTNPSIPDKSLSFVNFYKDGTPKRIIERATSKIVHFEGEFSWTPKIGEKINSVECGISNSKDLHRTSVEWRIDKKDNSIKEAEFFISKPISKLELAKAFNVTIVIEKEKRKVKKAKEFKFWGASFLTIGVLFSLMSMRSCLSNGKIIAQHSIQVSDTKNIPQTYGPFSLKEKGKIHKIEIQTRLNKDSWFWGSAELLDENKQTINSIEAEFYRESGRDSDGAWTESKTKKKKLFYLKNPGIFYIKLLAEKGTSNGAQLAASIKQGLLLARYYLLGALFCLGYGISIMRFKNINPLYIILGLLTILAIGAKFVEDD